MSKLPPEFVKSPTAEPAPRVRRTRKTSLVASEAAQDPREVLLRLTDDEHAALEELREKLHRAGEDVTLEQLLHRVLADWTLRMRAPAVAAATAAAPTPPPHRDETLIERLRTLAAAPLRTWRGARRDAAPDLGHRDALIRQPRSREGRRHGGSSGWFRDCDPA